MVLLQWPWSQYEVFILKNLALSRNLAEHYFYYSKKMGEMAKFERLKTEEPLESRKSKAQKVKDTADDIGTYKQALN